MTTNFTFVDIIPFRENVQFMWSRDLNLYTGLGRKNHSSMKMICKIKKKCYFLFFSDHRSNISLTMDIAYFFRSFFSVSSHESTFCHLGRSVIPEECTGRHWTPPFTEHVNTADAPM